MKMYHMNKSDAISTINSSRGSQIKFFRDGYWYKIDESGPEGMAEELTSLILRHSSLSDDEYVQYESCQIEYGNAVYPGCRSKSFINHEEQFVSYAKIYEVLTGGELDEEIIQFPSPSDRIAFVCHIVEEFSGLNVAEHIAKNATLDMVTLNTDRHFHNIGIITDKNFENARNAPIFDNGAAFLSNYARNNPSLTISDLDIHSNIFGRPYAADLEYQAVCAGINIQFDFDAIFDDIQENYSEKLNTRIVQILLRQIEFCRNIPTLTYGKDDIDTR